MKESMTFYIGNGNEQHTQELVNGFLKMPEQAQGMILSWFLNPAFSYRLVRDSEWGLRSILKCGCDSPIEYTYAVALCLDWSRRYSELWKEAEDDIKTAGFEIFPQYEIEADGKTYFADFLLSLDYQGEEILGGQQWQGIVIECDGFEYHHATKEQVSHDNDRELAIKKAGYQVLRFSGSQIYNDPYKCADDTIDYIISEMNRRSKEAS